MTCRVVARGAFVAALGGLPFAALPARAMGEFSAGPWKGMAFYKDASLTHCGMTAHGGAATVLITLDRAGELKLGMRQPGMTLTPGRTLRGFLALDAGAPAETSFKAQQKNLLVAALGHWADAGDLRRARRLRIRVGDIAADFAMDALPAALAKLAACAQRPGV